VVPPSRPTTTRNLGAGCAVAVIGLIFIFSPLVLGGSFSLNKYLVAIGVIALCLGLSLLLNGAIDLARRRGGNKS
jgi:hypothetical protein